MEIIEDERASFENIAAVIETDQALAARILKIANSAFYGLISKVSSVEHAVAILGPREVRSIVLGLSVYNFFSSHDSEILDPTQFWKHAIVCSQVARLLGRHFNIRNDETLFVAGLVHDIGKVVVDQYFHEEFLMIVDSVSSNGNTFSRAEKKILGTTHYQIGAKLLQQWSFPKKIIVEVLYHHAPWHDQNYPTGSIIIYLANILSKLAGYPFLLNEKKVDLHEFAKSPELTFIVKNGFDLDYEAIKNLTHHIGEFVHEEAGSVMRMFEE
jgi:putative nucleotidyltransferase with HDIG domain